MYMYDSKKTTTKSSTKPTTQSKTPSESKLSTPDYVVQRNSKGLPGALRSGIESLSGFSMENVSVHYNSSKPIQLQAFAYTQGTEIHVAPGKEKYLPHEAWHVVQQMQGRVKPTGNIGGEDINDSALLEREADIMGEKAARTGNMSERILQSKECIGRVSQLAHIDQNSVDSNTQPVPTLIKSHNPTIIFESMSQDAEDAREIFRETMKYGGNSILVFGLNYRLPDQNYTSVRNMNNEIMKMNQITDAYPHFFRGFTFGWTKPSGVDEGQQYKMPFIEARAEVMNQAEKLVKVLPDSVKDEENEGYYYNKYIFRWIDGDARDDTSYNIPAGILEGLSNGTYNVVSGSYKWRPTVNGNYTHLNEFIDTVNQCEQDLRQRYFESKGQQPADDHIPMPAPGRVNEFILNGKDLNNFYLPETTLMLSEKAHTDILRQIHSKQAASEIYPLLNNPQNIGEIQTKYGNMDLDGKLKNKINAGNVSELARHIRENYNRDWAGFEGEGVQDKESMKILQYANIPKDSVYFERRLMVTKPLKGQLNTEAQGMNYFGNELFKQLKSGANVNENEFYSKLLGMRQSVFAQFINAGSQYFTEYRKTKMEGVYACYMRLKDGIKDDLDKADSQ